ncbi:MAG: hypothetical protein EPN23_03575 [Verrucomicrobia bacterium]|nr:MAG: hypothetical protein EPN23_03575 [Verrucomicrobiota bacterium]
MHKGVWTRFGLLAVGVMLAGNLMAADGKRCVVVWSEGTAPKNVYPHDINGAVANGLKSLDGWEVLAASLNDPDQGLPDSLLNRCDVLVWWGHKKHKDVNDALVQKIVKRVKEDGMGFIALHSAHFAKPNIALMSQSETKQELLNSVKPKGHVAAWGAYVNDCTNLKVTTLAKDQPIAQGVPAEFNIVHTERYDQSLRGADAGAGNLRRRLHEEGRRHSSFAARLRVAYRQGQDVLLPDRPRDEPGLFRSDHPKDHRQCGGLGGTGKEIATENTEVAEQFRTRCSL